MDTQHDVRREQETSSQMPSEVHAPDMLQKENLFPGQRSPLPGRPPRAVRTRQVFIGAVIVTLVILLSLGIIFIPQHPPGPTPTPTPRAQTCPAGLATPAYWNAIVGADGSTRFVQGVSCAPLMGTALPQALVLVRHTDAGSTLDVFVFNEISDAHPTRIFLLQNLVQGDAKISRSNTVMTAEVDSHSGVNAGKPAAAWTKDLFREFGWNAGERTLVQKAFPGIFPDLTRWQAELDQTRVALGEDSWKNDPREVALKMGEKFFAGTAPWRATLLSGGGAQDTSAAVKMEVAPSPRGSGPQLVARLSRLEGSTRNIWEVTAIEGDAGLLTGIKAGSLVASPVRLEGKGSAFEGVIGQASVLDHLYTTVGRAMLGSISGLGMAQSPYSVQVSYSTSLVQGAQEGVVVVQQSSPLGNAPFGIVMVKVLLDSQPRTALGPVSCPLAVQQAGYWDAILRRDRRAPGGETVSCANLKGDPSLQALIPVYRSNGLLADVYVYDHIIEAHPVQLFKLQGLLRGSAMISGVSTVLIARADRNSSINKGKPDDQLTADLYREFQWDGKTGGFVQVVFPGMYPDLTRWQAEVAQERTMLQQGMWQLDALQTARHFVTQFLPVSPSSSPVQVQLVSGGGAHDLTARVNAAFPIRGTALGPITQITLKRLENEVSGVWEVTAVQADWMSIASPQGGHIDTPVKVTGDGSQFESQVGTVYILDHLYTRIGNAFAMGTTGFGSGPFTVSVPYVSTFQGGSQEGLIELVHTGGASFDSGVVMVKVLIDP